MIENNEEDWPRRKARKARKLQRLVEKLRRLIERNAETTIHADTNGDSVANTNNNDTIITDDNDDEENVAPRTKKMKHVEINLPWKSDDTTDSEDDSIYTGLKLSFTFV